MAIKALSQLNDWELVDKDKDVRGKTLRGPDDRPIGEVKEMIVDTDRGYVIAIQLDNGMEYSADSFVLREGTPVLLPEAAAPRPITTDTAVWERETVAERPVAERPVAEYPTTERAEAVTEPAERTMRLREEQLRVQRRAREAGEVELSKHVETEQRTIDVPVTREEVVVERHPVDRRPADRPIGEGADETIRVPIREEDVTVEKEPVVTEEVSVGKRRIQETRQVSGTVRREELDVDREGDVEVQR